MSPSKKLDKRLYAAKILGIILFVMSILLFCINISAGLMSLFFMPQFNDMEAGRPLFSVYINWMFSHYTVLAFSGSVICIPLFFAARALYKFKEWGRVGCIIMLFLMMFILVLMACFSYTTYEVPFFFTLGTTISNIFYIAVLIVGVYFLMRRSTREGIRDYNLAMVNNTVPTPEDLTQKVIDPRYDLAKGLVADVTEKPLPKKRKSAALIVAGIMMIVIPAFWILISLIITLNLNGFTSLFALLSLVVSSFTLLMGITVIWNRKRYRLLAVLASTGSIIMLIIPWTGMPVAAVLIFISYYIAILTLLLINYHKFFEEEIDDDQHDTDIGLSPIEMELQEMKILSEAKAKGEINDTEFEQKAFEIKVNIRTQPLIDTLVKRKNNGMLSEEEFQNKKEKIIQEKHEEVKNELRIEKEKQELHARRFSQIATEKIEKLSIPNKTKLGKYIDLMDITDVIVFHDQQIKLIRAERWAAINEANTQDQFEIILQLQAS